MSERIKVWSAWIVSALFLAAGLWAHYSPAERESVAGECAAFGGRSVAIVIYAPFTMPGIDVYWLEPFSSPEPLLDTRSPR